MSWEGRLWNHHLMHKSSVTTGPCSFSRTLPETRHLSSGSPSDEDPSNIGHPLLKILHDPALEATAESTQTPSPARNKAFSAASSNATGPHQDPDPRAVEVRADLSEPLPMEGGG